MAAVGLSDVFKYGTRLLANLLVVVLTGMVLVLAGNLVGEFIVGTVSNPDIRMPPTQVGWAGVAVAGAGVLVTFAGLCGLLFKLVADGTAVGTRSVLEAEGVLSSGVDAEGTDAEVGTSDESGVLTQSDETAPAPPGEGDGTVAGVSEQPMETTDPVREQQSESASSGGGPPPQHSEDAPNGQSSDPDRQQPPATGTEPPQQGPPEEHSARMPAESDAEGGTSGVSEGASAEDPSEWTPPDPEEFEQHQSTQTEEQSPDAGADPFAENAGFEDDTKVVDEGQFDEPPDSATTWDDLRDSSEESTSGPVDEPATGETSESESDDWSGSNPFGNESASDNTATESEGSSSPPAETEEGDSEPQDAYDEEFTETEGGDDPLSDALEDE